MTLTKNQTFSILSGAALLAVSALSAQAQAITVPNFSFEDQTLNAGGYTQGTSGSTVITDWTISSGAGTNNVAIGVENETSQNKFGFTAGTLNPPGDGVNVAFINDGGAASSTQANPATITSASALTNIAAGTSYTLTVAVGNPAGGGTQVPGDFELSLLANGTNVATSGFIDANTITDGTFENFSVTLDAVTAAAYLGDGLTIQMAEASSPENGDNAQIMFDNVQLTGSSAAAVPEPSAWAMMGLGLVALVFMHRRASRTSLV